jgi:hypothetical protein
VLFDPSHFDCRSEGEKMKTTTRRILVRAFVWLAVLLSMIAAAPPVFAQAAHIRWDIISIASIATGAPGGIASAFSENGSQITITGSGTFVAPEGGDGTSSATTGGGTFKIFTADGTLRASGTYAVTGLVRWEEKGTFPTPPFPPNTIGGLAILRVEFSDGTHGVLTVSCHSAIGSSPAIFEGITITKDFVDFWNRQAPVAGVDANRTQFHVL